MKSTVLALRVDQEDSVEIPQFQDAMGMTAAQWAQLYVNRMTRGPMHPATKADCAFVYSKIKEQYPSVNSAVLDA